MLLGNLLVFTVDGRDVQCVVALDKTTGKTVWKESLKGKHSGSRRMLRTKELPGRLVMGRKSFDVREEIQSSQA